MRVSIGRKGGIERRSCEMGQLVLRQVNFFEHFGEVGETDNYHAQIVH